MYATGFNFEPGKDLKADCVLCKYVKFCQKKKKKRTVKLPLTMAAFCQVIVQIDNSRCDIVPVHSSQVLW